ncbi:transposase [Streptomyces sp. NPDC005507]|uniref:transposase n=1 Tax=Streptomyces sp. NPDC005507 TaxID=3154885 RepID=UPI0033A989AD
MPPRRKPNPNTRRDRTVIYTLHAHSVFTPRHRRGPFTDEILTRCEEIMRAVCADFETELVEFNGERNHSARRLRQEFPGHIRTYSWGDHFWSPSHFAASCGGAPLAIIKEYIENQNRPD